MYKAEKIPERRIRVLLGKSLLDVHDRGLRYIAKKLMEQGMEVIYTNFGPIEDITQTAAQEDVDVIGVGLFVGGHLENVSDLMESLKTKSLDDRLVIAGGIIPTDDIPALEEMGVAKVFGPGTRAIKVSEYIIRNIREKKPF